MEYINQLDYWNSVAEHKYFTTNIDWLLLQPFLRENSRIVDYGCGQGRITNELFKAGYKNILGFDPAERMIVHGKAKYPHLDLNVTHNNSIACDTSSVDILLLFAVLTCIYDNNTQKKLISEVDRVLKPNGIVYINDFLLNSDKRNTERYEKYETIYNQYGVFKLDEGGVLRHHHPDWVKELTNDFRTEIYKKVLFKTMNGHQSNGFVFIGTKK